jgi:hypothetical protein
MTRRDLAAYRLGDGGIDWERVVDERLVIA